MCEQQQQQQQWQQQQQQQHHTPETLPASETAAAAAIEREGEYSLLLVDSLPGGITIAPVATQETYGSFAPQQISGSPALDPRQLLLLLEVPLGELLRSTDQDTQTFAIKIMDHLLMQPHVFPDTVPQTVQFYEGALASLTRSERVERLRTQLYNSQIRTFDTLRCLKATEKSEDARE